MIGYSVVIHKDDKKKAKDEEAGYGATEKK